MPEFIAKGPLFDNPNGIIDDFLMAAREEIAKIGVNRVKARLSSVLQNPKGKYESQIRTDRQQDDYVVTDGRWIYGPWLEGTGSRNAASRFKGYSTFRIVKQELDQDIDNITKSQMDDLIKRLNG